ncbi:tRNA1Val (adenine37-N6)-methyltransferase [Geothermobacter ehrlichii]|uniref:tRNA1Val (Adenine37-N6)-methyltransferase n=1 Tax=Geothermobacter ehrlichii TaxID=213224 RepID=A0A5D3WHN2_9BACT|nr:methyltransferase [Geothermobacter ehrlichii]TYO96066.1 tRNA1Val (adenine37-N6)-methyltransferase [Geothermobacter ehrlichii]
MKMSCRQNSHSDLLHPDETLDELGHTGLSLIQAKAGYRFSLDPFLLCGFAPLAEMAGRRLVDLGCGNGVIPLLAARQSAAARIVGIEQQPAMVERARRSVRLNGLDDRIEILAGRVQDVPELLPVQSVDLVLSNPPFRPPRSGRIAPDDERAAARHELAGGLDDFVRAAAFLLKNGGRFCLVHLTERLTDLLTLLRQASIEPKRLRLVHSRRKEPARLVLVEGRRAGRPGLTIEPPLVVYEGEGYSAEVLACYGA